MPAPLAPGTDINSNNQPAGLLEVAMLLQASELAIPEETRPNNVSVTFDSDAQTATIAATLPVTFALDANGQAVVTATDYIV